MKESMPMSEPALPAAHADLKRRFSRLHALHGAQSVLHWDAATMMPKGGADARSEQLATLALLCHEVLADPALPDLFAQAEAAQGDLPALEQANLREMKRVWRHASAVPGDLVESMSRAGSKCEMIWREARPANDFAGVLPHLEEVLKLTREMAAIKSKALDLSPYDALIDQFDPGGSTSFIDPVFAQLESFLPDFIPQVLEHQASRGEIPSPAGPFPVAQQKALGQKMMGVLGFDFDHGRLDVSAHPFCGGTPTDVRLTTRYDEADYESAMMGVLHETGHALYEMGLPREHLDQPVGQPRGMAAHESQSLLMEMQVCRSEAFLSWAAPVIREAFPDSADGPGWEAQALYHRAIHVERGFIRVDADEVTYPAHIILRYRLERALLSGDLALSDLPGAWNDGMQELLGVTPPDDRQGCLQDIHWFDGAFGYFPSYTLGAMVAAQLFQAARQQDSAIDSGIAGGDLKPLLAWLRANVHSKGSSLPLQDMLKAATGEELNPAIFISHLKSRYLS